MTDNKVHDLYDDVPRFLAEALKTVAPDWVSMADLVEHYDPPKPNNMTDIQSDAKQAEGKRPTVAKMKERLLTEAVVDINLAADEHRRAKMAEELGITPKVVAALLAPSGDVHD